MPQSPTASALSNLAAPLAASLDLELWGIETTFSGRGIVRVFVESENGVSIEQCAELSRLLSLSLDVEDIIPGAYVLEVSSPGLERTFFTGEQLALAVGERVEITLHQPQDTHPNRKKFRGLLQNAPVAEEADGTRKFLPDELFTLEIEEPPGLGEGIVRFVFADIKKAKQIHFVPEPVLPGKKPGGKKAAKKKPIGQQPDQDTARNDSSEEV